MDHKRNEGFIFLFTLLLIAVISLLLLTSMQHILLYYKAINQQHNRHQDFYHLELVAMQLAGSKQMSCVVHEESANQMMQQLIRHEGCSLQNGGIQYKYFIEDLGEFPCLVFNQRATHHRRVSVVQLEEGYPASLLQIRYISSGSFVRCAGEIHAVILGVSSWRYFALVKY